MKQSVLPFEDVATRSDQFDLGNEALSALDRIALAQLNPKTGALIQNTERVIEAIRTAKAQGAQLVATGETVITGYCSQDKFLYDEYVEDNKKLLERIAAETKGIVAVVGFVDYDPTLRNDDGTLRKYNAAAILQDGELIAIRHKTNLPNYSKFDDKRYFSSAQNNLPVTVKIDGKEVKLGIVICEDTWDEHYSEKVIKSLAEAGAEIFIAINNSPTADGKYYVREELIRSQVAASGKRFVYVNNVGVGDIGKTIIPNDGESLVYDSDGTLLYRGQRFVAETNTISLKEARKNPIKPRDLSKVEEIFNTTVMSVRDLAQKLGFKRVLAPVSGGIDSEVGLAVLVEAFGAENVIAVTMPARFNSESTKSIASETCAKLGVKMLNIPIQELLEHTFEVFEKHAHPIKNKTMVSGCAQGRLRMLMAMMECNDNGDVMLVSFANKTEAALGYSNLYGIDGAGVCSPLGDLNKMKIFKLGRYINERYGAEIIPEKLFPESPEWVKPSAEQEDNQFDPFDYPVDAPLMDEFVDRRHGPREVIELFKRQTLDPNEWEPDHEGKTVYDKYDVQSFEDLVYKRFQKMLQQPFKRLQQPPSIAIGQRAFGFDYRETIINGWDGRAVQ